LSGVTTKSPRSFVITVTDRPVAVSVTTTVACGAVALEGSVTVPTMRPAFSCARALAGAIRELMRTISATGTA
jgi:hypothetical protein